MKNEILYLLLDSYADHESVFLAEAINCDENGIRKKPQYINKVVAQTLSPIRSCGGFRTIPDYSFDTVPDEYAALILIGGYGWLDEKTTDKVVPIVKKAIDKGIIVGAICNAASFLAKYGFLNNVKHTGNGLEQLKLWGGNNYTNQAGYINEQTVSDKRIVTSNGTGELEFAKELLLLLENDTPEQIEMFYRFNKEGFCTLFP
ncbi:DJ-1/PfpI family protein [uncultured Bacteroides sp.]|uniref:DJ-1/PfpI family protein n=1 Tax=uncultured Bacteroides sp. TaxID=162156 RepID=UPI00260F885C|nr:DJ-1/PfpI family protein [uncultured Bacteroides sp.]